MRTVIDHTGCTTYPYGNPSFDVTVPTILQGVDILASLKALTERVAELELKLSASMPVAPIAATEPPKATAVNIPVEVVSEPVQVVVEALTVPVVIDSVLESVESEAPVAKQTKKSSK